MNKSRLVSGRVKKTSPGSVDEDRYDFLDLSNAEPDLGVALDSDYVLVSDTTGVREWKNPTEISALQGDTGFTGSQGETGFIGSQGDIGFTGSRGFIGSFGFTGSQGAGFTGSQGDVGFTGSGGDTGFTGSQGDVGFTGSAGTEISITTSSSATDHFLTFSAITSGTTSTLLTNTAVEVQPSTGKLKATSFSSTSDANLKVNINEISEALPVLDKIKSYSFNWKQNGEKSYGVVAQEIENVLPELVSLDTKGLRAVDYNGLIPFLIKAIKELKEELNKK